MQRHATACPRKTGSRNYAPHRCTGKWYYVLEIGRDSNGKRIQEMKGGFDSQREASEARAARRVHLRSRPADAYRLTVANYLEDWLAGKRRIRQTTRESYRQYVDTLFVPRLGALRLAELEGNPRHLEEFFTWLAETPNRHGHKRSPATVRRVYATLRAALNAAVRRRLLTFNPALAIELAEVPRPKIAVWTADEAIAFLTYLEGDEATGREPERLRALYHLAVVSAMRRGELLGQRWDIDLDTDEARTHVEEQHVLTRSGVVIGPPKTKAGSRPVWFGADTAAVLADHRARQAAERAAWGEAWIDTGLVFTREDGSALRPDHVSRRFQTLAKRAGVPVIRFHDLRHSSISLGLELGVALKVMSERAGHSSSWFTADTYAHVDRAQARDAGERIGLVVSLAAVRAARAQAAADANDVSKV